MLRQQAAEFFAREARVIDNHYIHVIISILLRGKAFRFPDDFFSMANTRGQ
jgi:hypothetical protein